MTQKRSILENIVNVFVCAALVMTALVALYACFSRDLSGEAAIGSFEVKEYSDGWTLITKEGASPVTLPTAVDCGKDDILILRNSLPEDLDDETSLVCRAAMEDVYIYIDGALREQYATESSPDFPYYLPSAYVVTQLTEADAGKELEIKIRVKTSGTMNEIYLCPGNNGWFQIAQRYYPVNVIAFVVLILGVILLLFSLIMRLLTGASRSPFYLSLLMIDVAIWIFSESRLRQLFFHKPSLSSIFAYTSVEIISILAALYFDEVQHRKHHRIYLIIETAGAIQLVINIILSVTGVAELYRTILFSHIIMAFSLVVTIVNLIRDIISRHVLKYRVVAIGMLAFLVMAGVELLAFYVSKFYVIGSYICIGLVALMLSTLIQTLLDQIAESRARQARQNQLVANTIETIAGTIDAKDEYTGGHSDRVGEYAAILARGMAEEYHFSEEDIARIHYIGVMHDIGKIGVADSVLNKAGRLTDEEYSLMKKHVEIGSELMAGMDETVPDLYNGIRHHHERYDGAGYPDGLRGTEIPLVARIICLADSYDAMTSNRVYRKRLSDEEVRAEIIRCSGAQFDPVLAEIFVRLMDNGEIHPLTVDGVAKK
ncbi:MAG: HD-GYP domain-containing protein [Lachnospiraceae bacterium]|nr:HD-GYP domain-containing protein [Lachnospiraceae bacterium]